MLIEANKLIGLPIAALDTASKVAEVKKILIDPSNGNVLGFLVSSGGIFSAKKVVSAIDIREWDPNGLVTNSVENLVDPKEIVRIKEVLGQKIDLFGMKAKTKKGKNLGNIEDFLIDTAAATVMKYYIKDLVLKSRVFPSDKVVKIEKGTIVFDEDLADVPSDAAGVPA